MRRNTKLPIIRCLLVLLLAVTALGGCKADDVKPVGGGGRTTTVANLNQADFDRLANHTLLVSLERGDARAVGGSLQPEAVLPLTVGALLNVATAVIPKQSCPLVGLVVETDNNPETREWLAMQDKTCPPVSSHGWHLFWVVQQGKDGITRVLFSDKAHSVKLMEWTKSAKVDSPLQRPVSVTRAGRTCPTCGSTSCEGFWVDKAGAYQRPAQFLVESTRYDPMAGGLDQSVTGGGCPLD
ncbi:MAG TPA: hypothetical protein PLE99_17625 [Candidatus Thiothrix moscowensis]|uniref:hypothetical protein n=1 Tax=unclassified Thiothrix TaxID=2636184 RepID=UPI0025D9CF3C|nr:MULTISPECIES: hypothetical protein [unclassified Thiothrix]HRJ54586.1 hypothetical protein [Candidatus Thiothrix moscowensis]HRJ94962.1 hypothetical protein [Candidatus Thiothrix moscowensis]